MIRPLLASRSQLVALRREAQEAGDGDQARLCTLALDGNGVALAQCTKVIVEALGNDEADLSTVVAIADMLGLEWMWAEDRVHIRTEDWNVAAFTDCWQAKSRGATEPEQSGSWGCACDIEDTLRALGGVE